MSASIPKQLIYEQFGNPEEVLKLVKKSIEKPAKNEVTVKWLLTPINPSDVACIQGNWPIKPTLPTCPGNEGVGEIVALGSDVYDLNIGDRVLTNAFGLGTWRTFANYQRNQIMSIPKDIPLEAAAILKINPCTAYRLLKDFVRLKAGDTVIQNGANSVVGQIVIQLCSIWSYKSVNIIRNRPNVEALKEELINIGADEVLTEEEMLSSNLFKDNILPRPKLALDCVSGDSSLMLLEQLDHGGILVCYGSMSKKNMILSPTMIRYKNLSVKGFWLTEWVKNNTVSEKEYMLNELRNFFKNERLLLPKMKHLDLDNYNEVFQNTSKKDARTTVKYVFDMTKEVIG